ncbi:MAG: sigma-70 family RNA polymerase sigma factor [Deltaproteobacteria bacterium]|nr:MAG: sigma-70 family RNA polymerase sigma factor [Deltaproteobacteria bacterium]
MQRLSRDTEFQRYAREVGRHPLLSPAEERALAERARAGDAEARQRLVEANLRFVIRIALQYRGYGLRLLDLVQEGNIGLIKAIERFEPERGLRLVTYAVHWIRAQIRAYILREWSLVRVGVTHAERRLFFSLPSARRALGDLVERDPARARRILAERLGVTEEAIRQTERRLYARDRSTSSPVPGTDESLHLEDLLVSEDESALEEATLEAFEAHRTRDAISRALDALDERQRLIIRRRYLSDEKVTLRELGDELGISRERVRQIEGAARRRLGEAIGRIAPDLAEAGSAA